MQLQGESRLHKVLGGNVEVVEFVDVSLVELHPVGLGLVEIKKVHNAGHLFVSTFIRLQGMIMIN